MAFFEEGVKMKQMFTLCHRYSLSSLIYFIPYFFGMIQLYQIKPLWYIYHLVKIGTTSYLTVV